MYSTCLFCHHSLGSNEVVEHFPVGRRVAYDLERGRLWAVCPACTRWNLSALEERWEALEECERAFRETRLRVATENVSLARRREGLDLIRVGAPQRPELAAWRYGPQLVRRMYRDLALGLGPIFGPLGMIGVGGSGLVFGAPVVGIPLAVAGALALAGYPVGAVVVARRGARRIVAREDDGHGATHVIRVKHLQSVRFEDRGGAGVGVSVESDGGTVELEGSGALRLASITCAQRNPIGGTRRQVQEAVVHLEQVGGPQQVLTEAAATGKFVQLRHLQRLALEMALHEEEERRALEGELAALEQAWRDAEEIAAIADSLLLPAGPAGGSAPVLSG